jgi:hypothetical protein
MGWPGSPIYGASVDPASLGSRQVPQNPATKSACAPIQVYKHARNGKAPDAWLINALCEATNQSMLYRTKEVFHSSGCVGTFGSDIQSSGGAGDRTRWRWAFHTGVYSRALLVNMIMTPQDSGLSANSSARIDIYSSATYGGSPVASATFNHGANPGGTTIVAGLAYLKPLQQMIEGLTPDTDYYGIAYDVDNGRMVSCSVAEMQSATETFAGYMPQNITAESSILDVYREKIATAQYNLWRRSAGTVFTHSVDLGTSPAVVFSATPTNIFDISFTTYGSAIPGLYLNMDGKTRLSQAATGVPVRFCAYVDVPAANTGVVNLRDNSGSSVIQISQAGPYTGWVTTTGYLPNAGTVDKYYLTHHRSAGAGTISTFAISCFQYE